MGDREQELRAAFAELARLERHAATLRALAAQALAAHLTPSADVPACRDEDPAHAAALAACYPDPHDHATHPEDQGGI